VRSVSLINNRPGTWSIVDVLLLIFSIVLILLRFYAIDADFPLGVTVSGVLYTDEGFYSNAAVRHLITGNWYLAGDFNPIVSMPLGQLFHAMMFGLFGSNLISVRLTGLLASSFTILLVGMVAGRLNGRRVGLIAVALLASSYVGFAYSRLAIMENLGIAFVALGLFLIFAASRKIDTLVVILAGISAGAAVLTKGSMIFAIPLFAYSIWLRAEDARSAMVFVAVGSSVSLAIVLLWQISARHYYPDDYGYFIQINVTERGVSGVWQWIRNLLAQCHGVWQLGKYEVTAIVALCTGALAVCRKFRVNPLSKVSIVYIVIYILSLSAVAYSPSRYFLPLLVPIAILGAVACNELFIQLRSDSPTRWLPLVPPIVLVIVMGYGASEIGNYLLHRSYSFKTMAEAVRAIIDRNPKETGNPVLLGDIADSVAIVANVRAVNTDLGTTKLLDRIHVYQPSFVITAFDADTLIPLMERDGHHLTKVGEWRVYENYYRPDENVALWAVEPLGPRDR
jgi:4-amino-4-deoxy-L-arabinose transferase-like glycosyltransferase